MVLLDDVRNYLEKLNGMLVAADDKKGITQGKQRC